MKNLFLYLIIFLLLNTAGGIYFLLAKNALTFLLVTLLVLYSVFFNIKIKKNHLKNSMVVLFIFILLLVFNYLVALPGQSLNTYAYMALTFFIVFLLINIITSERLLLEKIYKVLVFIETQSLIGFLLYFIIKNNLQEINVVEADVTFQTFHYLFFYSTNQVRDIGTLQVMRNHGFFWEPGILQIFLNILLYLKLFYFNKYIANIAKTLMAIFSTFSTCGLLIMTLLLAYKYKTVLNPKRLVIYFPVLIIIIGLFLPIITENIEDKFYGENAGSALARQFDALQALVIIHDFPLTGVGITATMIHHLQLSYDSAFGLYSKWESTGNSNSFLGVMVMFGLPIGLLFLYSLYKQNIFNKNRKLFFIMLVIALNSEPILLRGFFFFLMFSGLQNILRPKKSKTNLARLNRTHSLKYLKEGVRQNDPR